MKFSFIRASLQLIILVNSICLFGQESIDALSQQSITVELLMVEYNHENGFNWGIDILNAQKAKFGESSLSTSSGNNISLSYSIKNSLDEMFKLNLQALVQDNIAKITQNPRVTVTQGKKATLNIQETKYVQLQSASNNGLTTNLVQINAGINLDITPEIINESKIHLIVSGVVSEFQETSSTGGDYTIESKTINTEVNISHGETLVIGGLIKEEDINLESGVPVLRKIPLLGKLFSRIEKKTFYKEIVIYITIYIGDVDQKESKNKSNELKKIFSNQELPKKLL
jgi:type II secretory pathway component GspD/PulD (secretin)